MSSCSAALEQLRTLVGRHGSRRWVSLDMLPNVTLAAAVQPTVSEMHLCQPSLTVVVQGMHQLNLGEITLRCGPGQYLVIPVDLPVQMSIVEASQDSPFLSIALALKPEKIAALLLESSVSTRRDDVPVGVAISDGHAALLEALARLLSLLNHPTDIPVLAGAYEREVLWRLINGPQGAMVRQVGLANSRMKQIALAITNLRSRYAEILRIDELASAVGMSTASFHRHFRTITSMTPIQYQKRIRLQEARTRLLSKGEDVGSAGFAVGYESASQFSREYKKLFGLPPGKDIERLREQHGRN